MVTVNEVFRDFVIDGTPSSGAHKPKKAEVRQLLSAISTGSAAGLYDFIPASNVGAGTPNAIQATTDVALPATPNGALIALPIVAVNTAAPVTVSFNGGAPLTIKTAGGNDPVIGGLSVGVVAGYVSGTTFRLLSDIASAAIVAAAETQADRSQAASQAAVDAMSSVVPNIFATRAAAAAYSPTVAPSFFNTAGFAAAGDGGAALFKPSAMPFGDSLQGGGGADGWTASNGTLTPGGDYLTYATTGVDSNLLKSGLSLNGAKCRYIVIDLEVVAGTAEEVTLYYATAGHSFDPGYRKVAPAGISTGLRRALIFDMHDLTDGANDWANSTITELRIDITNAASAEFRIRAIAASKHAGVLPITLDNGSDTVVWYEIASDTLRPQMFGSTASDLYWPAQAALDALAAIGGGTLFIPSGSYNLGKKLVSTGDDVTVHLDDGATINHDTTEFTALEMQGARSVVRGGVNGGFVGPAAWDPVDGAGSLTYAVIRFTGEYGRADRTRVFNIRRVGIQFKDVNNGTVEGCVIDGNQPSPTFPLTLTNHHGIHFDNGAEDSFGNFKAIGNTIRKCTQGIDLANFGSGGNARGTLIANNVFEGCWDHGIYTNYANGITITGNNFNDCHLGVAASGPRHTITGNSFVALSTGGGETHVAGISLRDPQYCVVSDNVFFGTLTTNSPICIDLACFTTDVSYNVVANNTMRCVGRGVPIRITYRSQPTLYVYDNIVEGNNIVAPGRANEGLIQIEGNPASSGVVNSGNIVRGNRISINSTGDNANFIQLGSCFACLIEGNVGKLEYNAAASVTTSLIYLSACTDIKTADNLVIVPASLGQNVALTGLKEVSTCLRNEGRFNRAAIGTSASGFSYTDFAPASGASKLLGFYEGVGAPSGSGSALRAGSQYTRLDGGSTTSLYVNGGDGINWVAK